MRKILILLGLSFAFAGRAQTLPPAEPSVPEFEADRPDHTEAPSVVPVGRIQVETGILLRRDKSDNLDQTELLYPRMLVRIGLFRNVELRLVGDHRREEQERLDAASPAERSQGLNAVTVGTKVRLLEGQGLVPDLAILGHLTLPFGHSPWAPLKIAPLLRLAFGHGVTESLQIQYNLGWEREWEEGEVQGQAVYSFSVQQELKEGLKVFVEAFGNKAGAEPFGHSLDGGFLFLIRPNIQLDVWGGVGLSSNAPDFFIGTGIGFRLPR